MREKTPEYVFENLIKLPEEIKDSKDSKIAMLTGQQQRDLLMSSWKVFSTMCLVFAFYFIVHSIIPHSKYTLDHGFRKRMPYFTDEYNQIDEIPEIWNILLGGDIDVETIPQINFPTNYANGDRLSAFDRLKASDYIHFRVGPARLYQFRKESGNGTENECRHHDLNWSNESILNQNPERWQWESPLYQPWLYSNETKYPGDWIPLTRSTESFGRCGYEGEMGTSLASSRMILNNLNTSNWLDTETDALFFEQTYFNGNLNTFLMLRLSFERVEGGAYSG